MTDVGPAQVLELGRRWRGGSASSSSSITPGAGPRDWRQTPNPARRPRAPAAAEDEEAAAVAAAVAASTRLRSTRDRPRAGSQAPLDPRRAARCNKRAELSPCGGDPRGCDWRWCRRHCGGCAVRCLATSDLVAWQRDVGGLGLEDLNQTFPAVPQLPPVVPVVESDELLRWGVTAEWPAWALSLAAAQQTHGVAVVDLDGGRCLRWQSAGAAQGGLELGVSSSSA